MTSTTQIDSFEALVNQLEDEKIPFQRDRAENALTVPTRLGEENSSLHIRWAQSPGVIQFLQRIPFVVPEGLRDEMSIQIGRINVTLPIIGFTLNPENGILAFRTHAFLGKDGGISPGLIGVIIASAVRTTKKFLPQLKAVMS